MPNVEEKVKPFAGSRLRVSNCVRSPIIHEAKKERRIGV
jgi:hypothetical protein